MRASTVIRSIPTSETRTHASMTIPLSRTRSRTSIRLVPPAARSTGIRNSLAVPRATRGVRALSEGGRGAPPCQRCNLPFERADLLAQILVLGRQRLLPRREVVVVFPPVEADLLRFVDRADQQANSNRQQLDFRERHLDVARDHQAFVQDAVEHVDQPGGSSLPIGQ